MDEKKIKLNIMGLSFAQSHKVAFALILSEENGNKKIPVIIGGVEAQSIAIRLEKLNTPRPLTHDLFVSLSKLLSFDLLEVVIYKTEDGIFYSELVIKQNENIVKLDARTSDAIALAIRFDCPIYTYEEILEKAGTVFDILDVKKGFNNNSETSGKLSILTVSELKIMLKEAIEAENYEMASIIRDEIKQKEEQKI